MVIGMPNDRKDIPSLSWRGEVTSSARLVLMVLAIGILFDAAFNGQSLGVSFPLFIAVVTGALWNRVSDAKGKALLALATFFSIFPALRGAESLIAFDVLAILTLLATAVAYEHADLLKTSLRGFALAALGLLASVWRIPKFVFSPLASFGRSVEPGRVRSAVRTGLVAVPVVLIFAILLASADKVFADLVTPALPDWNFSGVAQHLFLTTTGVALFATLMIATMLRGQLENLPAAPDRIRLSASQWIAAMVGVEALFAVFVAVQFAFLFGGRSRVLVTPGLTYAEYARSGFFQLIAVSVLTVLLVVAMWDFGARETPRAVRLFQQLATGLVALTFVIVVSAFMRLRLYESTFGFTVDRFFAYVAICWIGLMLTVLGGAVWKQRRAHLLTTAIATALVLLAGVNVINPERFVAERNVARWRATAKIDTAYLGYFLGTDAVPAVTDLLKRLDRQSAADLRSALCERRDLLGDEPGWRSANLSRSQARRALTKAGVTKASCARRRHF
ncbi:MAG: DUF4173 domain-containing protein [Actinomycetota bacterium]